MNAKQPRHPQPRALKPEPESYALSPEPQILTSFMGSRDEYVVAGSDDGRAFVWERATGTLIRVLKADEDIVNCVQVPPCTQLIGA